MAVQRRRLLLAAPALLGLAACSTPPSSREPPEPSAAPEPPEPPELPATLPGGRGTVDVYVVPLDDFPETLATNLAKGLQHAFVALRVEAAPRLAPLSVARLPGGDRYPSEPLLLAARGASAALPGLSARTYRLFLTVREIHSTVADAGRQFSAHSRALNVSVVSLAGLLEPAESADGRPTFTLRTAQRLFKMSKRAVGEMRMGWSRSGDPTDLMYAPLTSVEDIDGLGLYHQAR